MTPDRPPQIVATFNSAVEVGRRSLSVLTTADPSSYSLQRLVVFDYLLVHSDDMPGGPTGLHPQTPHRGGEILVRRGVLQNGLLLYQSRVAVVGLRQSDHRVSGQGERTEIID